MADINAEGLNNLDQSVEGLNDTLNSNSSSVEDVIRDGLHEIKEEILKVAVQSLPKEFLDLAKQVESMTSYSKIISEMSEKAIKQDEEKTLKEKDLEKPGPSTGWTPDKLVSKVSEKEAAPSLTIIQSMNDLFGDKGTFLESLSTILENSFLKLNNPKESKKSESKEGGNTSEVKGPNDKLITQYSASIKSLDKLFGNILKLFFKGKEPRFSQDQIKVIEDTSKMIQEVNKVFIMIDKSATAVILAGAKAIPAIIFMPLVQLFLESSIKVINKFENLDKEKVKEGVDKATSLHKLFQQLALAETYALVAGVIAIPAAIGALLVTLFLLTASLAVNILDKLFDLPTLKIIELKTKSLITIFLDLALAEGLAIVGGLLALPAVIGVLLIAVFLVGVFVLTLLANILIGTVLQLVVVSILITISMAALFIAIVVVVKTIDFLKKSFPKQNEDGSTGINFLDFLLAIVSMVIPLALFIVAMFVLGLIATLAILPMVGLTLFSVFAVIGLIGIKFVISILVDTMVLVSNLFSGGKKNEDDPSPLGSFDGMAVFIGLLKMLLMFIPLILVIAMVALLGIVATIAAPFMLGLQKFNDNAPGALKGLGATIIALQEAIAGAYNAILGKKDSEGGISQEALSPLEGVAAFFSLILLAASIIPLILVIAMVAVLGAVATVAAKFVDGLQKFNDTAPGALAGLPKIITLLGEVRDSADQLFVAKNDTIGQRILNAIPGLGSIAAVISVLGKLAAVAAAIGAIGLIAIAADAVMKHIPAMKRFGDADTRAAFIAFKEGISSVGLIAAAAGELDQAAKPTNFFAGGIKGVGARLFGGNTSGLASQLGTVVAVLEAISNIATYSGNIQDNITNLRNFGGHRTTFTIFRTGIVDIIGELSSLVTEVTAKTQNMPTGGVKGFLSNIWGGSNNGLTTAFNTIIGIFESLSKLSDKSGEAMNKIESLGNTGARMTSLMDTFVPGLLQVFRIVGYKVSNDGKLVLENPELFTEKFWSRLEDVLDEIPGVIKELDDITKASKKLDFKVNFHDTVIEPILKLDPAIEKLKSLKDATKELNSELRKMTLENKDAVKSLGNIGKGGRPLFGLGAFSGSNSNQSDNMFEQGSDGLLEYIADDVHGIAQKMLSPATPSWTDKPRPVST